MTKQQFVGARHYKNPRSPALRPERRIFLPRNPIAPGKFLVYISLVAFRAAPAS
ncbi:MAG: hypothetical protein F6J93_33505 [Oscillatoria sp. SIO1A7]|nr:hypothetical protein [Oscillatoria sp. SIO1A7]